MGVVLLGVVLALSCGGFRQSAASSKYPVPGIKLFRSADRGIQCVINTKADDKNYARCISLPDDAPMGFVDSSGSVTLCNRSSHCGFDDGNRGSVLRAGNQISGGGMTCTSKRHAMVCKADGNGKGFLIDADKVKRVG